MKIHLLTNDVQRLFICVNGQMVGSRYQKDYDSFESIARLLINTLKAAGIPSDSIEVFHCPIADLDCPDQEYSEGEILEMYLGSDPDLSSFTFERLSPEATHARAN